MACTSYPLRREPSKRFRLAPPKSCEGVDAVGAETHTVASYYKARGLTARNEEWLWYEDLGLVIGHSPLFMGLEHWREKGELTHATLSVYDDAVQVATYTITRCVGRLTLFASLCVQLLRLIWFDFDGLACAPPGGFASWCVSLIVFQELEKYSLGWLKGGRQEGHRESHQHSGGVFWQPESEEPRHPLQIRPRLSTIAV